MKRFYFAGHTHFGNRGCEALIRSTVALLRQEFGEIEALVPSADIARDGAQWPDHAAHGVRLVPAPTFSDSVRWWYRIVRALPMLKPHWLPKAVHVGAAAQALLECDAIVMTGGDVISLDYGLPSLVWNTRLVEPWLDQGKPAILWAASVGPFDREPALVPYMARFLKKIGLVTVRESISSAYLAGLGLSPSQLADATDPAFTLSPEVMDVSGFWPKESGRGVLGFNVSPVIQRFRPTGEPPEVLRNEIAKFLRGVVDELGLSVLLLPHVDPLDGNPENSDTHFMRPLLAELADRSSRITMLPPTLNAAQLKHVLGRTSCFIGARTHATIGALSSGVPTLSIAYSTKARGINRDLFGDERHVIPTPEVSAAELRRRLDMLLAEQEAVRAHLARRLPEWRERAAIPARLLRQHLLERETAGIAA
jgi:colanic acid/amylovoran biosynthesis protein